MTPNLLAAVAVAALWTAIQIQVRRVEEPYLRQVHGPAYLRYASTTGRFVPALGVLRPGPASAGATDPL